METLSKQESEKLVESFIKMIKTDSGKTTLSVEFFQLTLHEPHYEMLNCAYIQSANKKSGLLYEALTNRYFSINLDRSGSPVLIALTKTVGNLFPKKVKDKMFWVCGNKKDNNLEIGDFGVQFTLTKPKI